MSNRGRIDAPGAPVSYWTNDLVLSAQEAMAHSPEAVMPEPADGRIPTRIPLKNTAEKRVREHKEKEGPERFDGVTPHAPVRVRAVATMSAQT